MQPIFELWDVPTRNLVDAYETEEAALEDVLYTLEHDGEWSVEALALFRDNRDDAPLTLVAKGMELAEYAKRTLARARAAAT